MNWITLIIATSVIYLIYYAVVIGLDLMRSKKGGDSQGYEVIDMGLDEDEEEAEEITVSNFEQESVYSNSSKEFTSSEFEKEPKNEVVLGEVESQGMPVDEFLLNAKNLSQGIEF